MVVMLIIPFYPTQARTFKGVTMEDSITLEGQKLVLNGMALRKKVIFKVYVAGLYVPQKESNAGKILKSDTTRHGIMHFLRSVDAGKITEAWLEGLKTNTLNASPELKKQFDTLCSWMEDMKEGTKIILTYIPEKGTTITVKGKVKGTLEGKAFADALFGCWLGPKPGPGEDFKKGLLGLED